MAYEILRTLKKDEVKSTKSFFSRFVVVGHDVFSAQQLLKIQEQFPGEVKLLSPRKITRQDLGLNGPSIVRGESNRKWLEGHYPQAVIQSGYPESCFYKDQEFRRFSGRSKPEKLLHAEPYFTDERIDVDITKIYPEVFSEECIESFEALRINLPLLEIESTTPSDLHERAYYRLHLGSGEWLECEYLIWGEGPFEFLQKFKNKSLLSNEFIEFCEKTIAPLSLYVHLTFKETITDKKETLFIPLSYTHEWGHFVGEFFDLENGGQEARFISFVDVEHSNEEHISKILRILKKSLEKIFPAFEKTTYEEFISLSEKVPCLKIDDSFAAKMKKESPNLLFVGVEAPVGELTEGESNFEYSTREVSWLARGCESLDHNQTFLKQLQ